MSLLLRIAGRDCIDRLDRAATARRREGIALAGDGLDYWGIYTYGYVVEMRLKTAFYRLCGLSAHDDATGMLGIARAWAAMLGTGRRFRNLHDLLFWCELVIFERRFQTRPFTGAFSRAFVSRVAQVALHWREDMRYGPALNSSHELHEVEAATSWIVQHHSRLWR